MSWISTTNANEKNRFQILANIII